MERVDFMLQVEGVWEMEIFCCFYQEKLAAFSLLFSVEFGGEKLINKQSFFIVIMKYLPLVKVWNASGKSSGICHSFVAKKV